MGKREWEFGTAGYGGLVVKVGRSWGEREKGRLLFVKLTRGERREREYR